MTYNPQIAIIITTINRDNLLMECINSILENIDLSWCKLIIVDQNSLIYDSEEKKIFYSTACASAHTRDNRNIEVIRQDYCSGTSQARHLGIAYAKALNIPHIIIGSDSNIFSKSFKQLLKLILLLKINQIILQEAE